MGRKGSCFINLLNWVKTLICEFCEANYVLHVFIFPRSIYIPFVLLCTQTKVKGLCKIITNGKRVPKKTSQELRRLSSVTLNCQVTKIVKKSSSQLSEM